ncbi:hypothetical protein STRDD13_01036 [Streptococcus sp. DD13]|nr:hypothetical protein STRDD13_01036 [Streptococcus sp. DD13]
MCRAIKIRFLKVVTGAKIRGVLLDDLNDVLGGFGFCKSKCRYFLTYLQIERGWDKSPSLFFVFGLSRKTQWLSALY